MFNLSIGVVCEGMRARLEVKSRRRHQLSGSLQSGEPMFVILTLCFGVLVVIGCSSAQRIGCWLDVIDHPDSARKHHARPTPLVGGIALMMPLLVVMACEAVRQPSLASLFGVLGVASLAFVALGLWDDRHHLPPTIRLLVSVGVCSVLLLLAPELQLWHLDLGSISIRLGIVALPFTLLCLIGLQNAINMADGLNGLVIGLCIFWAFCLLLYAPPGLVPFLLLLLAGLIILLPYNLANRLFLGDAGSYALGVSIGVLMLYTYDHSGGRLPMLTVVLWLLVPVLDCLRVIFGRVLANRSPMDPDTDHLHHRLARSWKWPLSVLIYLGIASAPGLIAAFWPALTEPLLLVGLGAYGSVIWLTRARARGVERERDYIAP